MTDSKWKAEQAAKVAKKLGNPEVFETPYGSVVFFPDSPSQVTMLVLKDGTTERLRGLAKRTILSLAFATKRKPVVSKVNLN